jgi:hypothetical protein
MSSLKRHPRYHIPNVSSTAIGWIHKSTIPCAFFARPKPLH